MTRAAEREMGLDVLPPRLLSKDQAIAYCNAGSVSTFDDWVRRQIIPRPVPGTHKWDRHAIDRKLDEASGLKPDAPEDPYLAWKRSQDGARRA